MPWFSVHIETRGADLSALTDKVIFRFADLLKPHHGIATSGQVHASYGATISVEAGTAALAITEGEATVQRLAASAGLPVWPVVCAEVIREDVLDESLAQLQTEDRK